MSLRAAVVPIGSTVCSFVPVKRIFPSQKQPSTHSYKMQTCRQAVCCLFTCLFAWILSVLKRWSREEQVDWIPEQLFFSLFGFIFQYWNFARNAYHLMCLCCTLHIYVDVSSRTIEPNDVNHLSFDHTFSLCKIQIFKEPTQFAVPFRSICELCTIFYWCNQFPF